MGHKSRKLFIGMDVHKESIDIAVAEEGGEAGPWGFGIYRSLKARGHECWVVVPSNRPRRVRDRIKTDRRDTHSGEKPSEQNL